MVFSKPLYSFLGYYFSQLYEHPIRTKSVTCAVIASAGNIASQYIGGAKAFSYNSLFAYAAYGLLFGGTIPHYFYNILEKVVPEEAAFGIVKKLILERLLYSPLYIAFTLYTISRLEGKDHNRAIKDLHALYWIVLTSSWKYLTLVQFLNLAVVPPMLRVLILNLVGFLWTIYMANKRRQLTQKGK